MELYRTYPKLCTLWCCIEVGLYCGQMFGWASFVIILKQEGFYATSCDVVSLNNSDAGGNVQNTNTTVVVNRFVSNFSQGSSDLWLAGMASPINLGRDVNDSKRVGHKDFEVETESELVRDYNLLQNVKNSSGVFDIVNINSTVDGRVFEHRREGCKKQAVRLNLWFSIAVCVSYVACSGMGHLLRALGMRKFRLAVILCYIVGILCIGLATPELGWLLCPGLCCVGVSGMALYSSNIQMSFLFPAFQSTITALLVGLFDFSTIVPYLMKLAFEAGVRRAYFCIGLSILNLLLLGSSTLFMLPKKRIKPGKAVSNIKTTECDVQAAKTIEKETFIQHGSEVGKPQLKDSLLSWEYILHVYWMCVNGLRFVSFVGFFNTWMENKFRENQVKESYYLGVFSYVTLGAVITAITAGMLHDCQRRKYMLTGEFRRKRLPIILPLSVTSLMAVVISSLTFVEMEAFLNLVFILFTVYRSYVFSYEITFLNDVYPLTSFPVLFGVVHSSAGLSGMLQYPLFEWYKSSSSSPQHVNTFLICLSVSSMVHPLRIWYTCRKHGADDSLAGLGTEIHI